MLHPTVKNLLARMATTALAAVFVCSPTARSETLVRNQVAPAETFTKCWDYPASPDLSTTPAADESRVYFLNTNGKVEAADLQSATRLWSSELGGELISNLLVVDGSLLVVSAAARKEGGGSQNAILRSLSKQTGVTSWTAVISSDSRISLGVLSGNIVSVGANGFVRAFRVTDGAPVWERKIEAGVSGEPNFGVSELAVPTDKNEILVLSGATGEVSIASRSDHAPTSVLVDSTKRYLIGDVRGNVLLASSGGERLWNFKNGAKISFLLSYDSEFIAASFDNFIYKLSRGGNVEWKRRLSGRVAHRPLIIADTAVVSIVGDSTVYFIDLKDGKISTRIDTSEENVAGIATAAGKAGLVLSGPGGLSFYSHDKCPAK